ncbi:MAG: hypothetical protein M3268_03400, partial [Acidobacteriota bacterium]|nr:hypothetical protein [Acidobacteriota bacterium]
MQPLAAPDRNTSDTTTRARLSILSRIASPSENFAGFPRALVLCLALASFVSVARAQAGRVRPEPQPSPSPGAQKQRPRRVARDAD